MYFKIQSFGKKLWTCQQGLACHNASATSSWCLSRFSILPENVVRLLELWGFPNHGICKWTLGILVPKSAATPYLLPRWRSSTASFSSMWPPAKVVVAFLFRFLGLRIACFFCASLGRKNEKTHKNSNPQMGTPELALPQVGSPSCLSQDNYLHPSSKDHSIYPCGAMYRTEARGTDPGNSRNQ